MSIRRQRKKGETKEEMRTTERQKKKIVNLAYLVEHWISLL